jgi:hypothetical protein
MKSTSHISGTSEVSSMILGLKLRPLEMPMFLHQRKLNAFFVVFHSHTAVTDLNITDVLSLSHTHTYHSPEFSPMTKK